MNVLNRIIVSLVCLALVGLAVSLIGLAWAAPAQTIDQLRDTAGWLDRHDKSFEKTMLSIALGGVAFMALILLIKELLPGPSSSVKVTDLRVGDAVLSTASVGQRVEEAVRMVPNVADVKAAVKTKRKGVLLSLDLHVDPDANLATVTDEACEAARDVLTNRVHVELVQPPSVRLHYRELRLGKRSQPVEVIEAPRDVDEPPENLRRSRKAPAAKTEPEPEPVAVAIAEAPSQEATPE